jgi:hypothetical protein
VLNQNCSVDRSKSNIGPDDGGIEYALNQVELIGHPGVFASRVE